MRGRRSAQTTMLAFVDLEERSAAQSSQYNVDRTTTDGGTVTHHVTVGVAAADNRVAIDEMLPRKVSVKQR